MDINRIMTIVMSAIGAIIICAWIKVIVSYFRKRKGEVWERKHH